jgi:uncharacterized tellurite resistance protein B-like protein
MLRTLKDLFDQLLPPPDSAGRAAPPSLELATAVLLVEVMRADATLGAAERASVLAALKGKFSLGDDAVARLFELAETTARQASDLFSFTTTLNETLSFEDKVRMVEAMWAVAYADGELAAHEQHVLWRLADLLHVPHAAYINAKIRAKAAAGL